MMTKSGVIRLFAGGLLLAGMLAGLGGVTSPVARAELPGGACIPQPVTAADAELSGTLSLLDPAVVGLESRISLAGAGLRFPDPKCDGRYITVSLKYRWDFTTRPAGSTAPLSQTTTLIPRLTPDIAGTWAVRFTACPAGCPVAGTTITIPPLTRTLSFPVANGVEGRMSSDEVASLIQTVLRGSRIQISHTSGGSTVTGVPYTVRWTIPYTKYQQLCDDPLTDDNPRTQPAPICARWEEEGLSGQVTYHTVTPQFSSYIDFGGVAEAAGAPPVMPLPIGPYDHDIPTWKRAVFVALQPAGIVLSTDIDRVRLLVNNLHKDLSNAADLPVSLGGGGINIGVPFESNHPSVKCEAHFQVKTGYIFTVSEGWSDELCPDFDLSQMELSVKLVPGVANGALTLFDAQVTVRLTPQGVISEILDFMFEATDNAEARIAAKIREKLIEPPTRTALGEVLAAVLKSKFKDMGRIVSTWVEGSEWVVRYEKCAATSVIVGVGSLACGATYSQ